MNILVTPTTDTLNIVIESCQHGRLIPSYAAHQSYEIYIIYSGERSMYVNRSLYHVQAGDVVMISSNMPHRSFGKSSYTGICIEFTDHYLSDNFSEELCNRIKACFRKHLITISNKSDLDKIYHYAKNAEDRTTMTANTCLCEIMKILNEYEPISNPTSRISFASDLSSIGNYIQHNYTKINSLEDLCNHFNISKSHLCRIFKQQTGTTISCYINSLRIQHACKFLATTELPINEIAQLCGYNNTQYFNRTFKSTVNFTPLNFRKHTRELGKYDFK